MNASELPAVALIAAPLPPSFLRRVRPSFDPRPIGTLIDDYSGALWRPATPAIKAIHAKPLDALQHCHDANRRAHANGWAMLTPSEVQDSAKRFGVFYAAITAKFGSPNS